VIPLSEEKRAINILRAVSCQCCCETTATILTWEANDRDIGRLEK